MTIFLLKDFDISAQETNFAESKTNLNYENMKKRTEKENYRLFSVLLLEEKVYMNPSIRFKDICGWLGADAVSLGDTVSKELGMSGDLLLEKYRKADMLRIREKYGLDLDHENY